MAEVLLLGMMMSSMSSLTSSILSVISKPVKNDDYEPPVEMDTGYMEPGTVTGEYEPPVEWETRTTGTGTFRKRYKLVDGILIDNINDAEDIGICKTRCINDPECVGFNRKMNTCKLYSGNVEFKIDHDFLPHRGYKIIRNP